MDISLFSEFKTGHLVPITFHGRPDHSFIPNPLPPTEVSNEPFWPLLLRARTTLERVSAVGSQLPDVNLLLRPLQRREALTSNSLEGTLVTPQELLLFEVREQGPRGESSGREDWHEVFAYDEALRQGCRWMNDGLALDNRLIQQLHLLLLTASRRGRERQPGQFRTSQVVVGQDRRFVPPPPEQVPGLMANLETWLSGPPTNVDPLLWAYVVHYQFEAIHPFQDGNGRLGRLVLALCVYKWLDLATPCLYMSEYFEKHRRDYIHHLFRISTHGEWRAWLEFCLHGTIEQASASLRRCETLQSLKKKYHELLGADAPRAHLLIDELFSRPILTVADVQRSFKVSYAPARSYLERLAAVGILSEMRNRYPRTFVAHEVFDAAYGD